VSHDRRFLENVATRIVSVRDGAADVFQGGWRDFATTLTARTATDSQGASGSATRARGQEPEKPRKKETLPPVEPGRDRRPEPERGKEAFAVQKQAARDKERRKRRIQELEKSVADGEQKLGEMRTKLREAPGSDWEKLAELAKEEQALSKKVDSMMTEWARLSVEDEA
jgi:ATP-binding cassette subfamily F protein 3